MGCKTSKATETRGSGGVEQTSKPPFPTTGKDQAASFERELAATVAVKETDADGKERTRAVLANPFAVALAEHYRRGRGLMLTQRAGEQSEVEQKELDEKNGKRARAVHVDKDRLSLQGGGGERGSADGCKSDNARLLEREFTVLVNPDAASAMLVGLNADRITETARLFAGWVAHDVAHTNAALARQAHSSNSTEENPVWDCALKLELHGTNAVSEKMLLAAQRRLDTRVKREQARAARGGRQSSDGIRGLDRSGNNGQGEDEDGEVEPAGDSGEGVLFIHAVFSFQVKNSYNRKMPWSLEVCFHFMK